MAIALLRATTVHLRILGNEMIKNVGKYELCMVSILPIIFKRTRMSRTTVVYVCTARCYCYLLATIRAEHSDFSEIQADYYGVYSCVAAVYRPGGTCFCHASSALP